ncbi:hypothetical protein LXL04_027284 [Taraxacum kok-saghyz]
MSQNIKMQYPIWVYNRTHQLEGGVTVISVTIRANRYIHPSKSGNTMPFQAFSGTGMIVSEWRPHCMNTSPKIVKHLQKWNKRWRRGRCRANIIRLDGMAGKKPAVCHLAEFTAGEVDVVPIAAVCTRILLLRVVHFALAGELVLSAAVDRGGVSHRVVVLREVSGEVVGGGRGWKLAGSMAVKAVSAAVWLGLWDDIGILLICVQGLCFFWDVVGDFSEELAFSCMDGGGESEEEEDEEEPFGSWTMLQRSPPTSPTSPFSSAKVCRSSDAAGKKEGEGRCSPPATTSTSDDAAELDDHTVWSKASNKIGDDITY